MDGLEETYEVELGVSPLADGESAPALDSWAGPALSPSGRPTATLADQSDIEVTPGPPRSRPPETRPGRMHTVKDSLQSIKAWSISTYKCSRQMIAERLGKSTRTFDTELDAQITVLRDTQAQYRQVMNVVKSLSAHVSDMLATQLQLGDLFKQLAVRSPDLRDEFESNSASQRALQETGETLKQALLFFSQAVETLCDQTIEDTLLTFRQYESARVEYDAYRADLEWAQQQSQAAAVAPAVVAEAQRQHDRRQAEYLRLREKLTIKLRLLSENRVKVMQSQLRLFHVAVTNYFSGNTPALKKTLQHLSAPNLACGDGV